MDLYQKHGIQKTDRGELVANYLSFPLLGEVSTGIQNGRIVFEKERILELAYSLLAGWNKAIDAPHVLLIESVEDAQRYQISEKLIPILCIVEGECRQRALLTCSIYRNQGGSLEDIAEICSGPEFLKLKKQYNDFHFPVTEKQTIRILKPEEVPNKVELLLHMCGSNNKKPHSILDIALLIVQLLGKKDSQSSIAFPKFKGLTMNEALIKLVETHSRLPSLNDLKQASKFYGITQDVWKSAVKKEIPIKYAIAIAEYGDKIAKQASKVNTEEDIKKTRKTAELYWLDRIKKEGQMGYSSLVSEMSKVDGRKVKLAERLKKEISVVLKEPVKPSKKPVTTNPEPILPKKYPKKVVVLGKKRSISFISEDDLPDRLSVKEFIEYIEGSE